MNINQITAANNTNGLTGTKESEADKALSKNVANRDTFLTLLVAQLKNQDPLAPMEGAEFVAQLAQFNSLEQLININDRLDQMISGQQNPTKKTAGTGATTAATA